ncbi:MAG: DUF262 domain-containing protein [Polaromonas sp.]|nr:DUF262 domain-containing protein [Polaromonas sp.]MDO9258623.1 DUF262 domain-containing protein [Polaromonas sp.]
MTITLQNLTIRGESLQSLYASYLSHGFLVNRRYQRKLVWTIEEKQRFVDSLKSGYPVPLFLLTETPLSEGVVYEIIDGMQRLNAMFSFLEGDFDLDGKYFDLTTIPETKTLLDKGILHQKTPKLSAGSCRTIVTYQLPLSVSRNKTADEVDEVFRRINSYGRHLSRQELRQAGATGNFADLVRNVASRIRGDSSASDRLDLSHMKQISITNSKLGYGIAVDSLFWVANNILTRDQVRESSDEEVIADIFAYNILSPKPPANSQVLDEFYGIKRNKTEVSSRHDEIESGTKKFGIDILIQRYMLVHDEVRVVIAQSGKTFNQLMVPGAVARVPRYFQIVFLAFYQLLINEKMAVSDRKKLVKCLDGIGNNMNIAEGGNWSAENRQTNVEATVGIIKKAFKKKGTTDAAVDSWTTELENVLIQSKTENNLYDLKQGLHSLKKPFLVEAGAIAKIAKTLSAMANYGPGAVGYVIVGVTDEEKTAAQLLKVRGVKAEMFNSFHILGVDHEAKDKAYKKGLDSYFQWVLQELKAQPISAEHLDQILRTSRLVSYFGRHILVLQVFASAEPCSFDGKYYRRNGPHCDEISGEALKALFRRFYSA